MASLTWVNYHRARRGEPLLCVCGGDLGVRELAGGVFLCSACRQSERACSLSPVPCSLDDDAMEDQ